jgi:hypothetical protein
LAKRGKPPAVSSCEYDDEIRLALDKISQINFYKWGSLIALQRILVARLSSIPVSQPAKTLTFAPAPLASGGDWM